MTGPKIEDHVNFTARHEEWKKGKKLTIEEDTNNALIAYTLAAIGEDVQKRVEEYLNGQFNMEKLDEIEKYVYDNKEPKTENTPQILKKLRGPGTGRKISPITKNDDARTIIKSVLTRRVLKTLGFNPSIPSNILKKYLENKNIKFNLNTDIEEYDHISFTAKHEDWITVKKEQINEKTKNIDIALILASIGETAERKVEEYLKKEFKLEKLDEVEDYVLEGNHDPKIREMPEILENLISKETAEKLNNISENENVKIVLKSILTRRILKKFNFDVDIPREELNEYVKKQT